jgi:eukaryotic-like serine/threonine-protein kinase
VRTALDRAASRITGKFTQQPLVEAAIRQTIGRVYEELGVFPEAERQFQHALDLRRRTLGEQHYETLQSSYSLATAYEFEGRYAEAEPVLKKTLEARRRVLGPDHPDTLSAMCALGNLFCATGRYAQAERLLMDAAEGGGVRSARSTRLL